MGKIHFNNIALMVLIIPLLSLTSGAYDRGNKLEILRQSNQLIKNDCFSMIKHGEELSRKIEQLKSINYEPVKNIEYYPSTYSGYSWGYMCKKLP